MSLLRSAIVLSALATAAVGSAQTVLLRFKPPVGKSFAYAMTMSMRQTVPGMAAPMTTTTLVPMTLRAVSRAAGATTIETKMGQAKVTIPASSPMAGMKAAIEKSSSNVTSTSVVDEMGNLKNVAMKGASPMMSGMGSGMMQGPQGVSYPAKPVKVGDTWSTELDMSKMMGKAGMGLTAKGKIPIVYRLASIEKRGGQTLAKILISMKGKTTMNMPSQGQSMDMNMNVTGSTTIDTATGMAVSMTSTSDTDMKIMGRAMQQHMVMTMKAL